MINIFSNNLRVKLFSKKGIILSNEPISNQDVNPVICLDLNRTYQDLLNLDEIMVGDLLLDKKSETVFMVGTMQTINPSSLHSSSFRGISIIPFKLKDNVLLENMNSIVNLQKELSFLKDKKAKYVGNIFRNESKNSLFDYVGRYYSENVLTALKLNILYAKKVFDKNMRSLKYESLNNDLSILDYNLNNLEMKNASTIQKILYKGEYNISLLLENGLNFYSNQFILLENNNKAFIGLNEIGIPVLFESNNKVCADLMHLKSKIKKTLNIITKNVDEQKEYKSELLQFLSN